MRPTVSQFAKSKYLIYNCFTSGRAQSTETVLCQPPECSNFRANALIPHSGRVGGSVLLDCANTLEEAESMITMYKERRDNYRQTLQSRDDSSRIIYITNKTEWWPSSPFGFATKVAYPKTS